MCVTASVPGILYLPETSGELETDILDEAPGASCHLLARGTSSTWREPSFPPPPPASCRFASRVNHGSVPRVTR